jgi:glycine cleavage system aminomethyltransferase T
VTVWDVSVERCLEISGPDGFRFAQLLTCRDLSKCAVGQAKYVVVCDSDGGIINDPVLTRMDENTFWFALASSDALLFARGLRNAYPDLNVTIREADVAPMQIQGPKSKDLMQALLGDDVLDIKYYFWKRFDLGGIPVVVTRTGWTSEVGYEIYLEDTSKGTELWDKVMEAGAPFNVRPTGPSDIRRIEGGIFNWGADMTYENNPYEMGLGRLVDDLPEDASISIAALKRIASTGVQRQINGVEIDGDPFPALNNVKWPALDGDAVVGKVTSAIYSPRLKRNIGYCWLPKGKSSMGSTVAVETEWGRRMATVVEMPFVDPDKRIPVA